MADFYTKKLKVFEDVEKSLQKATKEHRDVEEDKLYSEVSRTTGFSTVVRKHVESLVKSGRVVRDFKKGVSYLYWNFKATTQSVL